MGERTADQAQLGNHDYLQAALEAVADQFRAKGWVQNEHWLRLAVGDVSTLTAVRAAHAEFQSTGDVHELARAVGNILGP